MSEPSEHYQEISATEFRKSGLLWLCNTILHAFGITIGTMETQDSEGNTIQEELHIYRTSRRGFGESSNSRGYARIADYLSKNIGSIKKDSDENFREAEDSTVKRSTLVENINLITPENFTKDRVLDIVEHI